MCLGISSALLRLDVPLNFDNQSSYSLNFIAYDLGSVRRFSLSGVIEIYIDDLADHSPVFVQPNYTMIISEDTTQLTKILTVSIRFKVDTSCVNYEISILD